MSDNEKDRGKTHFGLLNTPSAILEYGGKEAAIILSNAILILSIGYVIGILGPFMSKQPTVPVPCPNTEPLSTQ